MCSHLQAPGCMHAPAYLIVPPADVGGGRVGAAWAVRSLAWAARDGWPVPLWFGANVGVNEGDELGWSVGVSEGLCEGRSDGLSDGAADGLSDGEPVPL